MLFPGTGLPPTSREPKIICCRIRRWEFLLLFRLKVCLPPYQVEAVADPWLLSTGLHGFLLENATIYNSPIGYACSFNREVSFLLSVTYN